MTDWPAPLAPGEGLHAHVEVPGSKSLTNRLLVLAALADGSGTIRGALRSRDADLMIAALCSLGVQITEGTRPDGSPEPTTLHVTPPTQLRGNAEIDTGLAGTVMRFLPPIAALADGPVAFDGDEQARERPMAALLDALRRLGIEISPATTDALPFVVHGAGSVKGGPTEIDASASSQYVSALLLAAPRFADGIDLRHTGDALPSQPHIDMTVANLRDVGVQVDEPEPGHWVVRPGPIKARDVRVEPDLSNALPFLAAALVAGGAVSVPGWPTQTTQPGGLVPELLTKLGGTVTLDDGVLTVRGTGKVTAADLDLSAAGELAPNLAALLALADGTSRLTGIAHLRGHETNRLAALVSEITRLGGTARELDDGLEIVGRGGVDLHGELFQTYHDHRMATSGALLGLRVPGVVVENVETTGKTLPEFAAMWAGLVGAAGRGTRGLDTRAAGAHSNSGSPTIRETNRWGEADGVSTDGVSTDGTAR